MWDGVGRSTLQCNGGIDKPKQFVRALLSCNTHMQEMICSCYEVINSYSGCWQAVHMAYLLIVPVFLQLYSAQRLISKITHII